MLPCTKSYVSLSILKKMLTCLVCDKRVQNPHFYVGCKDHFFCFNCKGDGVKCPVCSKSLMDSELIKDSFLDDILKTSCFTIHDKDFEREKVPLHLVKELFQEFEKIDNLRLDKFAAKNHLKSPLKINNEHGITKKSSTKTSVQTKLDFFTEKKGNSSPAEKKLNDGAKTNSDVKKVGPSKNQTSSPVGKKMNGSAKINGMKKIGTGKNQIVKSRLSQNSKSEDSFEENVDSEKRYSFEIIASSDIETIKLTPHKRRSQSRESMKEKISDEAPLDSQSIFKTQKQPRKSVSKIQNETKVESSKKVTKPVKSEVTNENEEKRKSVFENGSEKKKSKQSLDVNPPKISKTDTNVKRSSKDNFDKSILEKDKKAKNIFKKNSKGETALHTACRMNKISQLKELLETDWKLHINDKDFAGWTPLHEAVTSGNYEISKILLEAGAWVFVPGYNFETPLHTALYKTEDLVKLIMKYGPDVEAKTITGQTPLSIAKELGLENLIKPSDESKLDLPAPPPSTPTTVFFHDRNLFNKSVISSLSKLDITVANNFSKDISHLVVKANDNNVCESSMTVLEAVLMGKFLLNTKWVVESINAGKAIECEQFEVSRVGNQSSESAPYKARLNAYRLFPGLFAGAFFYLVGNWRDSAKREKVISLINLGGGTILKREPDPENIPDNETTVMYHTKGNDAMGKCSHILLYNEESDGPKIKYRMNHIKTLPLKWLITCIETFSIVDPE